MIKNLVRICVSILATFLALIALWQFRIVVIFVLISLMLAASIKPLFSRLDGLRSFVRIVWIMIYILVVMGLIFALIFTIQASAIELHNLAQSASVQDEWRLPLWLSASFQQTILSWLPLPSVLFQTIIGPEGELVLPAILGIAQSVGGIGAAIAIILILSVYWSANQVHFERLWLSLLPSDQRKRARGIWQTIEFEIGAYIRGQGLLSLLIGLCLGLGYWLIGSPSPALLGLTGALASLVPVVGGVLIIVPTLIIGLLTSTEIGLITVIYTMIVLVVFQIWIKPRLFNRRWDNSILTVIILIAMADAFGIIGIILAPPISSVCQIIWDRLVVHRVATGAAAQVSDLIERLASVNQTINAMDEPHPPLVASAMERITNLVAAAEPELQEASQADSLNPPLFGDY
jgi:predicted PurR-regulated permease PerM